MGKGRLPKRGLTGTLACSSFDWLLESMTLAPPMALPLGSVTVPSSELDEVGAAMKLAVTSNCMIDRIANCSLDLRYSRLPRNSLSGPSGTGTARGQKLKEKPRSVTPQVRPLGRTAAP
jgi:hypothetical protein